MEKKTRKPFYLDPWSYVNPHKATWIMILLATIIVIIFMFRAGYLGSGTEENQTEEDWYTQEAERQRTFIENNTINGTPCYLCNYTRNEQGELIVVCPEGCPQRDVWKEHKCKHHFNLDGDEQLAKEEQ